jgi:hypothetical protein
MTSSSPRLSLAHRTPKRATQRPQQAEGTDQTEKDQSTPRQRELVAYFKEIGAIPGDDKPTTMRQRSYLPRGLTFRGAPEGVVGDGITTPPIVTYAAQYIGAALQALSEGDPLVPHVHPHPDGNRRRPGTRSTTELSLSDLGVRAWREARPGDFAKVKRAFKTLTGKAPEDFWESILEEALRTAIGFRAFAAKADAEHPKHTELSEKLARRVLQTVRRFAPMGAVPDFINQTVIELAMQQCSLGRGGGPGGARISIKAWIKRTKRMAKRHPRSNSKG